MHSRQTAPRHAWGAAHVQSFVLHKLIAFKAIGYVTLHDPLRHPQGMLLHLTCMRYVQYSKPAPRGQVANAWQSPDLALLLLPV